MITDFEGVKVLYRDIWDLQSKLKDALAKIQKDRESHDAELAQLRKQEKAIRHFLGHQDASSNVRPREVSNAA